MADSHLEPVLDWLNSCRNQPLRIEKEEIGDTDVLTLHLKEVSVSGQPSSMYDDYIAPEEIILHGEGTVRTSAGQAPLPGDRFEIALSNRWEGHWEDSSMRLQTGRAQYVITKMNGAKLH
ncbi:hypothetical protein [Gorillibacterium sp. sgz5001074]|uniref:hypothetical protein n=1 Tax=Gorillibacterium sp. sgz5001074 TaxID=3446695 RepID=UPI003F6771EB